MNTIYVLSVFVAVVGVYYHIYEPDSVKKPSDKSPVVMPNKTKPSPNIKITSIPKPKHKQTKRSIVDTIAEKIKPKPVNKKERERMEAKSSTLGSRMKSVGAQYGDEVFLRIFKYEKELELWIRPKGADQFRLLKIYSICNYSGYLGPKLKEGDKQSPEGFYRVYRSSLNPHSKFTLSFNLGYPNRYDRSHKRTGSYLMVHGKCASIGCYAMGDKNIKEIYRLVHDALYAHQKYVNVHIFPFRMEQLDQFAENKWYQFWQNLKEGYDLFEESKIPPKVHVKNKEYRFE